jgi:hypothetical protein
MTNLAKRIIIIETSYMAAVRRGCLMPKNFDGRKDRKEAL